MCRFALSLVLAALLPTRCLGWAFAQPSPWYEGFEGPDPSWRLVGGNARCRVEVHLRVSGEAHTGDRSEHIRVAGTGGSEIFFAHDVGRPRVIEELLPTVWVKSDRPGMQLLVQVALPRTLDPKTHLPVSTLLQGTMYTAVGRWQQLRAEDISGLLARKSAVLRARFGPRVDTYEAYVERVLLNVYGGPGVTNVWIDDLDIAGYVGPPPGSTAPPLPVPIPDWWPAPGAIVSGPGGTGDGVGAGPPTGSRIKLIGSVLAIDGRPTFPRILQYQGEPLGLLAQLGFNAISLPGPPAPGLLQEAKSRGIWVVCRPPHGPEPDGPGGTRRPLPEIGPEFDAVLAWDLGCGLGSRQLPTIRRWAEDVRSADRKRGSRPIVCRPESELWAYSRDALLVVGRPVLGTSLELSRYAAWLRERSRQAVPDTPIWAAIPTQPDPALREAWSAMGRSDGPAAFSSEQVRLAVYSAVGAGCRGILFESSSPLSADDPDTRQRAMTLELLNLELKLAEPWAAAGTPMDSIPGSEEGVVAAELQAERARLLLPVWCAEQSQFVPGQSAGRGLWFVVPGVPEASDAYELLPGSVRPVLHKRAALGMRVTLDDLGLTSLVLLTQDPKAITEMTARAGAIGRRAAELHREIAAAKLSSVARVSEQLRGRSAPVPQAAEWMGTAQKHLAQCDALLAARDHAGAYASARRAMQSLRLVERAEWEAAVAGLWSPIASPLAVCYGTLPDQVRFLQRATRLQAGANLLAGGDFEEMGMMLQAGWRHFQHVTPGVESAADLSPAAAHSGRSGLRMVARSLEPGDAPGLLDSPPVWITSAPVAVEAGQLLRIQGWVRVPKPITGSVDGLLIVDSLGGEPLAGRVTHSPRWQQFTLYRAAPRSGSMTVTVALTGLGEVWLDDVTVQALGRDER